MNRRQLLGAAIAAPFAGNVIPFPAPTPQITDATLTALHALNWNSSRVLIANVGDGTFQWSDIGDATRW